MGGLGSVSDLLDDDEEPEEDGEEWEKGLPDHA